MLFLYIFNCYSVKIPLEREILINRYIIFSIEQVGDGILAQYVDIIIIHVEEKELLLTSAEPKMQKVREVSTVLCVV